MTHIEREAAGSAGAETQPQEDDINWPKSWTADDIAWAKRQIIGRYLRATKRLIAAQGEPPQALDERDRFTEAVAEALSDESWQDPRVEMPLPDLLGDSILYHLDRLSCPRPRHDEHCADLHWTDG